MIADRKTWLEERRKGICATDIAAIAGVHPYKTALEVYLDKVEGVDKDLSDNEPVEWGNRLEDAIATKYAEKHGVELETPGLVVHPEADWRRATPDRLVVGKKRTVEVKTAGMRQVHRWGEEQTDSVPEEHCIQANWQLATLVYDVCDIAVLLAGQEYREYRVHRDEALEADLIQIGEDFWKTHVLPRVPPPLDGSDAARDYLVGKYPRNVEPLLVATSDAEAWANKYREAMECIAAAELDKAKARHELEAFIGNHDGVEGTFGKLTWKVQAGAKDWEAIAKELEASEELIAEHTAADWKAVAEALKVPKKLKEKHTSPGARVFRPYWKKGT